MIIKLAKRTNFVCVSRDIICHASLSPITKLVLIYLLSKPDDWEVQFSDVEAYAQIGRDKRERVFRELQEAGYFERVETRTKGRFDYDYIVHESPLTEIQVADETPINKEHEPRPDLPLTADQSLVDRQRLQRTNKNIYKETKKENKKCVADATAPPRKPPVQKEQSTDEWLAELSRNAAYSHIDITREYQKAQTWCGVNNRKATKRFFVNWLNRIEPPLETSAPPPQPAATIGCDKCLKHPLRHKLNEEQRKGGWTAYIDYKEPVHRVKEIRRCKCNPVTVSYSSPITAEAKNYGASH